ncbi:putative ribonuclease H-like domain-containing protein [Tanacetum coccineum]
MAFHTHPGFEDPAHPNKALTTLAPLYGNITEEVYVKQPPCFEDPAHPNKVYRVVKALYGLHQAPRAWYERLSTFLLKHGYRRGAIDKTLFIKKDRRDIMLVQVYVDDIIFGSTKSSMVKDFEELMQKEFKMSSMGELTFFFGLQVNDYAGDNHDRRSTSGGCQYLRGRLVSWQCKKQTIVAISSTEAEYVAADRYEIRIKKIDISEIRYGMIDQSERRGMNARRQG